MGERWRSLFRRRWWWVLGAGLCFLLILVGGALFVSIGRAAWGQSQVGQGIIARDLTLSGADFGAGQSKGPIRKEAGLALTMPAMAVYTSPVLMAPIPFSDLGAMWEADLPPGTTLFLEVRSSPDLEGERWTPWELIEEEDDLPSLPLGQYGGELYFVPQRDGVHQRLQYRLALSSVQARSLPAVRRLTFNFIDARAGPTTQEIMARQGPKDAVSAVDRPPVISRDEWGCLEGEVSPRWPPEYARVTHVIIHHTATPNDDSDWAARVRSIWYYHANTRGWGDIGYNYLIDPLGNVYEGRAGGEDVVGGHARSYNPGTMGIGNLGTYVSAPVPAPMQETMEALIAWKASQRGIDPLGSSFNNHMVYAHIAGHRDVGQTTCPGDVLYALIPAIRQNVLTRLLQQEEEMVIDEMDPRFTRSDAYWHDSCGREDHSWWTHTVTDPGLSTNWGIWRPDLPQEGWYEVFAYVPSCTGPELPEYTESAQYRLYYRGGGRTITVDQKAEQGRWVSLGTYRFYHGTAGYLYLDDIAGDHWRALWYDTVRWVFRAPSTEPPEPPFLQEPPEDIWATTRQLTLSWIIPPTLTLDGLNLVVATDPSWNDRIVDVGLPLASQYPLSLGQDYPALYWSVRAHNANGYGAFAPTRRFGVDTAPPLSAATALYRTVTGIHVLTWGGTDAGSGIASYTVQARDGPDGRWEDLWSETTQTSGVVELPAGTTRYFRVHARDRLGNEELPHGGDGDLSSAAVIALPRGWFQVLLDKRHVYPTRPPQPTATPSPSPTETPVPIFSPTPTATPALSPTTTATPVPLPTAALTPSPTPSPSPVPTASPSPSPSVPTSVPTAPVPPTSTRLPSPTPAGGAGAWLPDLRVVSLRSSQDSPFDCGRPTGIAVEVSNMGMAPAGQFYLALVGEGLEDCRWRFDGLQPGEHAERVCPVIVLNTLVTATVDLEDTIVESDEGNNTLVTTLSVLALPTCTPRPGP